MTPNQKIRIQYEVKLQLFKAEALSKLEALETRLNWIEEVTGL